jgi:hypothetical protein
MPPHATDAPACHSCRGMPGGMPRHAPSCHRNLAGPTIRYPPATGSCAPLMPPSSPSVPWQAHSPQPWHQNLTCERQSQAQAVHLSIPTSRPGTPNLEALLRSAPRTPIRTQALIAQHKPLVPGVRTTHLVVCPLHPPAHQICPPNRRVRAPSSLPTCQVPCGHSTSEAGRKAGLMEVVKQLRQSRSPGCSSIYKMGGLSVYALSDRTRARSHMIATEEGLCARHCRVRSAAGRSGHAPACPSCPRMPQLPGHAPACPGMPRHARSCPVMPQESEARSARCLIGHEKTPECP